MFIIFLYISQTWEVPPLHPLRNQDTRALENPQPEDRQGLPVSGLNETSQTEWGEEVNKQQQTMEGFASKVTLW